MSAVPRWSSTCCALEDIVPDSGVCALVDEQQVAMFRVGDAVHAIGNYDPASGANVLARGIVGDIGGELVVASPIYKQHFSLITGRCLEEPELSVPSLSGADQLRRGLGALRARAAASASRASGDWW